jgi:cyclic-di-AMP phosphodiesterase PgpH
LRAQSRVPYVSKRIQDLTTPMGRWRKAAWEIVSRPIAELSPRQRFWIGFALLSLVTTLLVNNPIWRSSSEIFYREGDVAREVIISPADIYYTDEEETERIRKSAMESVPPIFFYESRRPEEAVQNFRLGWEGLVRKSAAQNSNRPANQNLNKPSSTNRPESQPTVSGDLGRVYASRKFSSNELDAITRALRENASGDIYGDQDEQYLGSEITIIDRQRPTDSRQAQKPAMTMTKLSIARENLHEALDRIQGLSDKEVAGFYAGLAPLIQPSVIYDAAATDDARKTVAQGVQPVTIALKRSQKVADEGDVITPEILSKINAIRNYSTSTRTLNRFFGLLVLISALFWGAWKFIEHRGPTVRFALSEQKAFGLFGVIVLVQTSLMAAFFRLAEFTASRNVQAPFTDPSLWSFAVPFAMSSLLMTLLADRRIALFTGIFTSVIAGFLAPRGLEYAVYAIISSSVAAYGIGRYRSRQTVTIAGVFVGLASALLALAIIGYTQQPFILNTVLLAVACGIAGGLISAALTATFLPLFETGFGILTDVKLLELSNADLPVLGQLALRAPGTNQHSHAVGHLAEEACRIVGGNALLARIGALYHDIGKSAAPEHFVENQLGKNPHDRLKPAQSAKIIISHVTYGMKLARELGLPQRIVDFIPQHHGTRTLHYFYKKAQDQARPDEEVSENDFRYPGPKPQFKESAIMMIADSCEAAARSLAEPTPENIRFIVTKIIDAIVADDQLGECDLTLRELTQIREAMIRSLVAIYHSRIDYPGYTPPSTGQFKITDSGIHQVANGQTESKPTGATVTASAVPANLDAEERGLRYTDPKDIPISPGGEIEDEAIVSSNPPDKIQAKTVR